MKSGPLSTGGSVKYRGVNLGGWLVLERWMTPALFEGLAAKDETQFCVELGGAAKKRIEAHRKAFITKADLQWIKDAGLNAVRLPVPHWMFGDVEPYVGCVDYVDWLVDEAGGIGLNVLIDAHTAPGSQNGQDHSGRVGPIEWSAEHNRAATLHFLERLVDRYGKYDHVVGFELLNEPDRNIDHRALLDFYLQGHQIVHAKYPAKLVVLSDAYRPHDWSHDGLHEVPNIALDVHLYQAFSESDKRLDMAGHVTKATVEWHHLIDKIEKTLPVVVGEWSLATGKDASDDQLRAFAVAQLANFKYAAGWFYWNYKTESNGPWNFRYLFEHGIIPAKLFEQ